jgi:hypothetical protein
MFISTYEILCCSLIYGREILNDEMREIWNEAFAAHFMEVSHYFCRETEENHANIVGS